MLLRDCMWQGLPWLGGAVSGAQEDACWMQASAFAMGTQEVLVCRSGVWLVLLGSVGFFSVLSRPHT